MLPANTINSLSELKKSVDALPSANHAVLFVTPMPFKEDGCSYLPGGIQYQIQLVKGQQGVVVIDAKVAKVQKNLKIKMKDLDKALVEAFIA